MSTVNRNRGIRMECRWN